MGLAEDDPGTPATAMQRRIAAAASCFPTEREFSRHQRDVFDLLRPITESVNSTPKFSTGFGGKSAGLTSAPAGLGGQRFFYKHVE